MFVQVAPLQFLSDSVCRVRSFVLQQFQISQFLEIGLWMLPLWSVLSINLRYRVSAKTAERANAANPVREILKVGVQCPGECSIKPCSPSAFDVEVIGLP